MTRDKLSLVLAVLLVAGATPARAGGPLVVFDSATRTPYAYGDTVINVFTDLGNNGRLSGAESDALTAFGFAEWIGVPSSYFTATIAGDLSVIGLPDITGANAGLVIGTFNGRGIHVLYDDDRTITGDFFGAPPGVLGIAGPEFSVAGTNELTESWAVISGRTADPNDVGGESFAGVFTHEFGHAINLAHTQTNGAVGFFGNPDGPGACATPYPPGGLTFNEFETMYPFLDPRAGSVGIQQATVNVLDDIATLSNIYPASGWPNNTASISGIVYGPDGTSELTGINVIARNVADPFEDAISALSGDYTQSGMPPDGFYTFNGLTPGADYVVYIDQLVAGGFSTRPGFIPGDRMEEYWNAGESFDAAVDDPCDFTLINTAAGATSTANVIVNGNPDDLLLSDDSFVEVDLPFGFPFCGQTYNSVFVGSNGFVTFEEGDTSFTESVDDFLNGPPRIAGLWDDLHPQAGGFITALPDGDEFVVTYSAPEVSSPGPNEFEIRLRADGTYDVNYGTISASDGLAGRTPGRGADDPGPIDLSAEPQPIRTGIPTVYEQYLFADNDLAGKAMAFGTCVIPDPPTIAVDPAGLNPTLLPGEMLTTLLNISNLGDLQLDFNIVASQLFDVAPGAGTPGTLAELNLGPISEPNISDEVRLARYNQDRAGSRSAKPRVSPLTVPLPHAYAITLLNEDFDGGFPAGWSVVDNVALGVSWMVPQQGTPNHTSGTGNAAGASSDAIGSADFDTELRTPPITGFGPNVVVSYVANYQNFANFDFLDLDVSTDGGATWRTVLSWNENHGNFFRRPGEQVALNIDPFVAGAIQFILRWRYYDPSTVDFDWYAQIDDVLIVSDDPLVPCSFINNVLPASGTIGGRSTRTVGVQFDATGFAPGTYDCELMVLSNAVNEPSKVVPLTLDVAREVYVDVMPEKCPNVLQLGSGDDGDSNGDGDDDGDDDGGGMSSRSTLKVVLVGSAELDMNNVDLTTLELAGVPVSSVKVKDKYRPCDAAGGPATGDDDDSDDDDNNDGQCKCRHRGVDYSNGCNNTKRKKDGYKDAELRFNKDDVIAALGDGMTARRLTLTGKLNDGACIQGSDCLIIERGAGREWDDNKNDDNTPALASELKPASPNPFNPVTRISYVVQEETTVRLSVYDVKGRLVERLVDSVRARGEHTIEWRADGVASGIYFYRLEVGDYVQTRKMILLK